MSITTKGAPPLLQVSTCLYQLVFTLIRCMTISKFRVGNRFFPFYFCVDKSNKT